MTKAELISRIAELSPRLRHQDAEKVVATVFAEIGSAFADGKRVELRKFGTFFVRHRDARAGVNPRTRVVVEVPDKVVLSFRTSKHLQARLNGAGEPTGVATVDSHADPLTRRTRYA